MASRENQGYVIGIIVLAVIAVMLLVTTVFSTMKAYENYDRVSAAQEDAKYKNALATAFTAKSNMYAAMLGVEGTTPNEVETYRDLITTASRDAGDRSGEIQKIAESAQSIYDIYKKDMSFNTAITDAGTQVADADMTYKGTVDKMASALRSANANVFDKLKETERIRNETEQQLATVNNTLKERTSALTQAETNLTEEKARNKAKEADLLEQVTQGQEFADTQRAEFDDQKEELELRIAKVEDDRKFVVKQNIALKEKVNNYERQVFDLPDGKIVKVSASAGNVFVDLGRLDGVRANLTFVVYDRTANDFEKDRHKAKIEITEVIGPHLAKARITEEDPLNPILTKDYVLSATFDRGDAVTIALGGFIDLDNDGISDFEKLKRMIVRNGGRVVASHDEDGNITGEIDSSTRFFVVGGTPRTGASSVISAVATMQEQAEGNSVDRISLKKLLNWMGVHPSAQIERLDSRIGESGGFATRSPSGSGSRGSDTKGSATKGSATKGSATKGSATRGSGSGTR